MTAPQERPRYFYRDPLAAAWMAKHFGMRFTTIARNGTVKMQSVQSMALHGSYTNGGLSYRYFIHPDSLPLMDSFTADQKAAMQLLGLWPESEAA